MDTLSKRAVLMRLTAGLPGEQRQDPGLTSEVKSDKGLGQASGRWVKNLYPVSALAAVKKLDNEARAFHNAVTLPFDMGIGILPVALIQEYAEKMRGFCGLREVLRDEFLSDPQKWIDWAVNEHNGTFDPSNYPGCTKDGESWVVDVAEFKKVMGAKFHFETAPLPVPKSEHFEDTVASLLGTDTQSVNIRVKDAAEEAQKELLRRIIEPVSAMAAKLAEQPKGTREDIVFRDTLIGNVIEIGKLGPKLNLIGDPQIDSFCKECEALSRFTPETLRKDKAVRTEAQKAAAALVERLSGYKL